MSKIIAKLRNFADSEMMTHREPIQVDRFRYALPEKRIARYPLPERDGSSLLLYEGGTVSHHRFHELPGLIPDHSWMVFNNTRVLQARMSFRKQTGAIIEVFCLEPADPPDYQLALQSTAGCSWHCLVGNARKWKTGSIAMKTRVEGHDITVHAFMEEQTRDGFKVRFAWDSAEHSFGEILESAGSTPIPPYLKREAEAGDRERYQTIYNRDPGSVAAPTAGLHFTDRVMEKLGERGISMKELTLHVSAGTFVPVKQDDARQHAMHEELVTVSRAFLEYWVAHTGGLLAIGTTTTRSLETLYWLGARIASGESPDPSTLKFRQWENESIPGHYPIDKSLESLLDYCEKWELEQLHFTTSLMIVPGYRFRAISALLTNFHMPGSTLLLLVAALIGDDWRKVYDEALGGNYRFLSYGDSSLLLP